MMINTGMPRSVMGNFVSGSLAGLLVAGVSSYRRVESGDLSAQEARILTLKYALQSGVVAASSISAANYIGSEGGYFKALTSLSVGAAGVYAIERTAEMLEAQINKKGE